MFVAALPPSPPGRIVFDRISDDGQRTFIVRERGDGSGRVVVLRDGWDPVWSPDGRFIAAFQGDGIAVATRDGRVVRRVRTVGSTAYLTWSPDGKRFAYVAQHCEDPLGHEDPSCGTLWVVRVDGAGQRRASGEQAVALVESFERPYTWSPDGRRIAFAGFEGLVVSHVLTGRRHLLGPTARIEAVPDWSPDGTRLLYTRGDALVTSRPDGRDRRVVRGAGGTLLAAWSPDGSRIAYVRRVQGDDWRVFVSAPSGGARVELGQAHSDAPLVWSPDGRFLLVGGGGDRFEIFRAEGRGRPRFVGGGEDGDWGPAG
jgi:dipeptidyl aminopeptidase/acylaminoacyl peptidase